MVMKMIGTGVDMMVVIVIMIASATGRIVARNTTSAGGKIDIMMMAMDILMIVVGTGSLGVDITDMWMTTVADIRRVDIMMISGGGTGGEVLWGSVIGGVDTVVVGTIGVGTMMIGGEGTRSTMMVVRGWGMTIGSRIEMVASSTSNSRTRLASGLIRGLGCRCLRGGGMSLRVLKGSGMIVDGMIIVRSFMGGIAGGVEVMEVADAVVGGVVDMANTTTVSTDGMTGKSMRSLVPRCRHRHPRGGRPRRQCRPLPRLLEARRAPAMVQALLNLLMPLRRRKIPRGPPTPRPKSRSRY